MKKIAIITAGCGGRDGSEVQETVTAMYAVARHGMNYEVFAPDRNQYDVVNHTTGEPVEESRNCYIESARMARENKIHKLSELDPAHFDAVIVPGGFGAAKNLFTFAIEGLNMTVDHDVKRILHAFHSENKPIGAMCIAPMMLAVVFKGFDVKITLGPESPWSQRLRDKMGTTVEVTERDGTCVDKVNKIVTTPCYMYDDSTILEVGNGAYKMVADIIKLM